MDCHNYLEADSEFNWLQCLSNHEIQTLFSENLFANGSMEDRSLEIYENANLCGDLQQCFAARQNVRQEEHSATTGRSNSHLARIEPATCVFSAFHSDPAFVERGVKYSSFERKIYKNAEQNRAETVKSEIIEERGFESANSENDENYSCVKSHKAAQKAVNSEASERKPWTDLKRKAEQINNDNCLENQKTEEEKRPKASAPTEKPNYIHVRARRGEATDSHSLAERLRRNKIGERMKFLQDLVPGCSKIKNKVLMLEEIIDYVQSLHRQVEFLSIKLATLNSRVDFDYAKGVSTGGAYLAGTFGFQCDSD